MADIISGKSRFLAGKNASKNSKVIQMMPENETAATRERKAFSQNDEDDRGLDADEVRRKIKEHRKRLFIVSAATIAVIVIAVFILLHAIDGITYESYSVMESVNRDDSESASYIEYHDGYIRYSNDGIAFHRKSGNAVWNQTYTMQKPQVKICGNAVAVGDINGSKIYVFNESGALGTIDTSLAIAQIEVAKQGVVAAVLEDTDANYINLYNTNGAQIYSVKTSLAGDGYPLDISISEDATKLMASYLYVSGETMKTNVVFYNFSEVGKNETERIVGGFNHYESTIVGDVNFMNETTAVAVGENVVSIYKIKEYPRLADEIFINNEIERVFFSDNYIGVLLDNSESGDLYKLMVYNLAGNLVCQKTFNTQYDTFSFDGKSVVMNNSSALVVMNLKGKILAEIAADLPIEQILPLGKRGNYIMVNSKYVQNIKLK